MSIVHDNIINSYRIDFTTETMVITTQYDDGKSHEKTDVLFNGYLAHIFYNVMKGSVLNDIEEYPLSHFLEDEREILMERKQYGWPTFYETESDFLQYLNENDYRAFLVTSSIGLYGWIVAKSMSI